MFKQSSKAPLDNKIQKFTKFNLQSKFFLTSLFIGLNTTDKKFVEKSRILSLAVLPLMFPDLKYRRIVEDKMTSLAQS